MVKLNSSIIKNFRCFQKLQSTLFQREWKTSVLALVPANTIKACGQRRNRPENIICLKLCEDALLSAVGKTILRRLIYSDNTSPPFTISSFSATSPPLYRCCSFSISRFILSLSSVLSLVLLVS